MFKCYEPHAPCGPTDDCHQMTFVATRSEALYARILIRNLSHRHGLPLARPAVLLREGRPDTREQRKSSLGWRQHSGQKETAAIVTEFLASAKY